MKRALAIVPQLLALVLFHHMTLTSPAKGQNPTPEDANPAILKIGIIGLDTSHAPAFSKLINAENPSGDLAKMQVVAAFPGGSPDMPVSRDRVEGFTQQLREMDVEIVDSIDVLLAKVDRVLLLSVDGRKHLSQVLPVFQSGKPVFIDKPLAGNLVDAIAIDLLAKKYQARWFSSSSLRFSPDIARFRTADESIGQIRGAASWGPCTIDSTHTDLYWYGVHGVETLFTAMGTGCKTVTRVATAGTDLAIGVWEGERIGSFRGLRDGQAGYGMVVFGEKAIEVGGKYTGYAPLIDEIAQFFLGGDAPVSAAETLEMFTWMQAADESKSQGGIPVALSDVWDAAYEQAKQRVLEVDP
ncbi:MAG: gfo/Idh/MocA family oxidoreductase [bacterium]|nr:gfo/Idh/MocA family oxidoreductase [bacterium]